MNRPRTPPTLRLLILALSLALTLAAAAPTPTAPLSATAITAAGSAIISDKPKKVSKGLFVFLIIVAVLSGLCSIISVGILLVYLFCAVLLLVSWVVIKICDALQTSDGAVGRRAQSVRAWADKTATYARALAAQMAQRAPKPAVDLWAKCHQSQSDIADF
ncbi:hypothetical protein Q8F55_006162 [Vanrija albida]|uniref:Uncharacterized protein n=1 Tax=Vanrija albida TaxID=181172 RepID=A0ABR3PXA3_9TREE